MPEWHEEKTMIDPLQPRNFDRPTPPSSTPPGPVKVEYLAGFQVLKNAPNFGKNLLFGSIFLLIPLIGPLVLMGWIAEVMQRYIRKHPRPVPSIDFGDFGHYLGKGVVAFVCAIIVSIPLTILYFIFAFGLPMLASQLPQTVALIVAIGSSLLFIFFIFLYMAIMNAVVAIGLISEDFGTTLRPGFVLGYAKKTLGKQLLGGLVMGLVSIPLMIVGMLACFVGLYPAMVLLYFAMYYLQYQIYQYYLSRGGQPIPMKPERALPSELVVPVAPMPPPPAQ